MSLPHADGERLDHWVAAYETPQQVALRCRIVCSGPAPTGRTNLDIGMELGFHVKTVTLSRGRFAQAGQEGLWGIAAGCGRKPTYSCDKIKAIVRATLMTKPK